LSIFVVLFGPKETKYYSRINPLLVGQSLLKLLRNLCPGNNPKVVNAIKWSPVIQDTDHIIAFFDGASILKGRNCGAGGVFKFSASESL
jgi:hypothetical protein